MYSSTFFSYFFSYFDSTTYQKKILYLFLHYNNFTARLKKEIKIFAHNTWTCICNNSRKITGDILSAFSTFAFNTFKYIFLIVLLQCRTFTCNRVFLQCGIRIWVLPPPLHACTTIHNHIPTIKNNNNVGVSQIHTHKTCSQTATVLQISPNVCRWVI